MSAFANVSVLEAARHCVGAISAWLDQPVDVDWQPAKRQHDRALCAVIQDLLAQPLAIAPDNEWLCRVVLPISHSDPEEEWYDVTRWWEMYVSADGIVCDEYTNLATIIGAGQTPIRKLRSSDEETGEQQAQLAAWLTGLDEALTHAGVSVDVASRWQRS